MRGNNTTQMFLAVLVALIAMGWVQAREAMAQTFFETNIPADAAAPDYVTVATFTTPVGTGTDRRTVARILIPTPSAASDIKLQIVPPAGKTQPEFVLDVGVGVVEVSGTSEAVADIVRAEIISDAPDNAPVAAGFVMVRVTVLYNNTFNFTSAETWALKIKETSVARTYRGFIATGVGGVEALVTKPKIKVLESELNFGEVQEGISTGVAPVLAVNIQNVGTGPLTISGAPITVDPVTFTQAVFAGIPTLDPGAQVTNIFDEDPVGGTDKKGLWIMAQPASLGDKAGTLTIQSNDINVAVPLKTRGISLYAELLLDVSGSMEWKPNGSPAGSEQESRLWLAKQAGKEINNWIREFSGEKAYLGLSTFPGTPTTNSRIVVPIDRSINTHPSINLMFGSLGAGGLSPTWNGTPMADGFHAAVSDMEARLTGSLPPDPKDKQNLRQAILLLSDGAANRDSATAPRTPREWIPSLVSKDIRTYTIGYGQPGSNEVDWALLQDLASGTTGSFFDANANEPFALKNAFKNAIKPWLGLRPVVDPTGVIRRGQSKTHSVCIDGLSEGLTFVVDWDRHISGAVDFILKTPKGATITPSSSDVKFYAGETYAMYVIQGRRVRGGQAAGQWTLQLNGSTGIPSSEDTRYSYSVLVKSKVEVVSQFPNIVFETGKNFLFELAVSNHAFVKEGHPKVSVSYDNPAESYGTYLSKGVIDPSWILGKQDIAQEMTPNVSDRKSAEHFPIDFGKEPLTLPQKKAYVLKHIANQPFGNKRSSGSFDLYDDGTHGDRVAGDGIYSNWAPTTKFDGVHKYRVNFESVISPRACIFREDLVDRYVSVALSSELMAKHVRWKQTVGTPYLDRETAKALSQPPPEGFSRKTVTFTPQDEAGNYWGPGHGDQIAFAMKNAEPLGRLTDNLDGSYGQIIQYRSQAVPAVVVNAQGIKSDEVSMSSSSSGCGSFWSCLWEWIISLFSWIGDIFN